jgi:hypothetical protein
VAAADIAVSVMDRHSRWTLAAKLASRLRSTWMRPGMHAGCTPMPATAHGGGAHHL